MGRLIDENNVISSICSFCDRWDCNYNCLKVQEIRKIPTAQPERKTGRWVSQKGGGYCCSECGRYALDEVDGNFIHVAFESNFCPYCGAEMVEK